MYMKSITAKYFLTYPRLKLFHLRVNWYSAVKHISSKDDELYVDGATYTRWISRESLPKDIYEVKFTVKKPAEIKKIRSEFSSRTMDLHRDFLIEVGSDFVIFWIYLRLKIKNVFHLVCGLMN